MRAEEIRELNDSEIQDRVGELNEELFRLKFRSATETLEEPLRLRAIRRDIARMRTVLRERQLGLTRATAPVAPAGTVKKETSGRARRTRGGSSK